MPYYNRYLTDYKTEVEGQIDLNYGAFDIESFIENDEHICGSMSLVTKKRSRCFSDPVEKEIIYLFLQAINEQKDVKLFYAHNAMAFDFKLILKILVKNIEFFEDKFKAQETFEGFKFELFLNNYKKILTLKIRLPNGIFHFRDSKKIINYSLAMAALSFTDLRKGDLDMKGLDRQRFFKQIKKIEEYCENDSKILLKVLQNFSKLLFDITKQQVNISLKSCITLAGISWTIFRKIYYEYTKEGFGNEETTNIANVSNFVLDFLANGYFGGKVEIYKKYCKKGVILDVNSLYPFIMKNIFLPIGTPVRFKKVSRKQLVKEGVLGFVKCRITFVPSYIHPFLGIKGPDQTIYPVGNWEHVYYSESIVYALKLGYKIDLLEGWIFPHKKQIFSDFIDNFYSLRLEAKKDGNFAKEKVLKLILNSLFGRFGLGKLEDFHFSYGKDWKDQILPNDKDFEIVNNYDGYGFYTKKKAKWHKNQLQISAAITSGAAVYMDRFIQKYNPVYTDTDSLFLSMDNFEKVENNLINSEELGLFKIECNFTELKIEKRKKYSYNKINKYGINIKEEYEDGFKVESIEIKKVKKGILTKDPWDYFHTPLDEPFSIYKKKKEDSASKKNIFSRHFFNKIYVKKNGRESTPFKIDWISARFSVNKWRKKKKLPEINFFYNDHLVVKLLKILISGVVSGSTITTKLNDSDIVKFHKNLSPDKIKGGKVMKILEEKKKIKDIVKFHKNLSPDKIKGGKVMKILEEKKKIKGKKKKKDK